jgi:hypothetical protein
MDEVRSRYYLHLEVLDRPGVLHTVSACSPSTTCRSARWSRRRSPTGPAGEARIIFITHEAPESAIQATLATCASSTWWNTHHEHAAGCSGAGT